MCINVEDNAFHFSFYPASCYRFSDSPSSLVSIGLTSQFYSTFLLLFLNIFGRFRNLFLSIPLFTVLFDLPHSQIYNILQLIKERKLYYEL